MCEFLVGNPKKKRRCRRRTGRNTGPHSRPRPPILSAKVERYHPQESGAPNAA